MLVNAPIYTALVEDVSFADTADPGDLLEVRSPADCILIPLRVWITTEDEETSQQIGVKFGTRATAGSGGTSVTPEKSNQHLQASQTTCLHTNTTDASGAEVIFDRRGFNSLGAGYMWEGDGDTRIVPVSTSLVLHILNIPATTNLTAGITFAELGQ